jgi:CRISPR-associated endonuclease/helicase Cas3
MLRESSFPFLVAAGSQIWRAARLLSANGLSCAPYPCDGLVNRLTVVDQATAEAEKLRKKLLEELNKPELAQLAQQLRELCAIVPKKSDAGQSDDPPLAISTLRGQFADNGEWCADPSRPAIVVGTIDMIGSRLLFSGYGLGFKRKPLHAGFLGQDSLIVHDEAHLEPAFQDLLEAIKDEQIKEKKRSGQSNFKPFHVMALSATSRDSNEDGETSKEPPLELTIEEKAPPEVLPDPPKKPIHFVWHRLKAKKSIRFQTPEGNKEKVADRIGKIAKKYADEDCGKAILIYVRTLEDHAIVKKALDGQNVQVGTMPSRSADERPTEIRTTRS